MYDVIVVGGGPIGSYTAGRLAEKGHRILVLERKPRAGESVCCTGIIGQECVNIFAIEDKLILRWLSSAHLFSPSGNELYIRREEPQACILDRVAFDIYMAERARGAGAEYAFNSRATDVTVEENGVSVNVSCRGKESKIRSRAVVIASGFAPGLNRKLGLGIFGDFTIGAQVEVATPGTEEVEVYFGDMAPGFFAWIAPTTPSMARVGLLSRKKPGFYLRKWLEHLAAQGKVTSADAEMSYGGIPIKPPQRTYGERLVAVGDAAGQVKPTSGGGIYYGLLSADVAVKTLHRALIDGDLSAKRLAAYERGWRKILRRELRIGYWARKLYERLSDRQIDRIFEIMKANGIDEALLKAEDLSFDRHSQTILRLLKYQIVARTANLIKLPFRSG
jgi:digeranylgeranylglycerophospholipid reductase